MLLSNSKLLLIAAGTFISFAISELFAAYFSNSLSLFSDAITMIVDSFSYIVNLYSEKKKGNADQVQILKLELYAPMFSVTFLYIVSVYVIYSSFYTLQSSVQNDVDDKIMLVFSLLNFAIDIINMICFYQSNQLFSFFQNDSSQDTKKNLNMCSALTHVCGDFSRTIAVLVAATISTLSPNVSPTYADAIAAIIVSILVIGSTVPLLYELRKKYLKLQESNENSEREPLL